MMIVAVTANKLVTQLMTAIRNDGQIPNGSKEGRRDPQHLIQPRTMGTQSKTGKPTSLDILPQYIMFPPANEIIMNG